MIRSLLLPALATALGTNAGAQTLMVVESTTDTVMLIDGFDGSVINPTFIDLTVAGASTPIEALVVGDEIWISDQVADSLFRFTSDGMTNLPSVTGGMDNIRGFEVANGHVYVSNSGTGNGAPGDAIVVFDTAGNPVTSFPAGDPFDVLRFGDDLMISNIAGDDLDVHAQDGTFLFTFHNSDGVTGIDFPEQVSHGVGGNILAAGFSAPSGIFEYDSTGVELNYYDTGAIGGHTGLRGVWPLGNGNILYTNGSGVHVLDPVDLTATTVVAGVSGRFISELPQAPGEPGTAYCFGDGSGTACPCGNDGDAGQGCANGTGQGAVLSASGSNSVANDDLVLLGTNLVPGQPGLYFQGNGAVNGGQGIPFGDGLRCANTTEVRLQIVYADGSGESQTSVSIATEGGVSPGETKFYQLWYRDPTASPCGSNFNLSNGYQVTWTP